MSLLRLLTAGKTLVGAQKAEGRYEVPRQRVLPRFGGKRNPFRTTIRPEVPVAVESPEANGVQASQSVMAQVVTPEPDAAAVNVPEPITKNSDAPEVADAPQTVTEAAVPASEVCKSPAPASEKPTLLARLRSVFKWPTRKKPFSSPAARAFVQAELSLEKVRVIRNDLNDTDLEVVPAGVARAAGSKSQKSDTTLANPPAPAGIRSQGPVQVGRLFGSDQN